MAVVFIPSLLRPLTGGAEQVRAPGATLRQVINNLEARYPGVKSHLVDELGRMQPGMVAAIDGETNHLGLLESVGEDSEVHFIPAVGGG
ncbi:MAG: MoaD/ThiS family protein [Chloroflexi bacterium]|nr:MoaD/ThiS family protein [Chloroflexota bacterium]